MKKIGLICSVFLFVFGITGAANAVSINYNSLSSSDGTLTTPYSWATVETFDNSSLLWTWTGTGQVVSGSVSGQYAAPGQTDLTKYIAVPNPLSSGSYTATLVGMHNYFGLYWGSVDQYNTLSFLKNGSVVASFGGIDITSANAANGNQTAPSSNLYVNFLDLPDFNAFKMTSTNFAFEADNIAVGNAPVPEPATMFLMGVGLVGLAAIRRRKILTK